MKFISEGNDDEINSFYSKKYYSSILGSKNFISSTLAKINDQHRMPCSPDINRTIFKPQMDVILEAVVSYFHIEQSKLYSKTPGKINFEKMIAIYLSSHIGQLSHSKIAAKFALSCESVGATLKRCREMLLMNDELRNHINRLSHKLAE